MPDAGVHARDGEAPMSIASIDKGHRDLTNHVMVVYRQIGEFALAGVSRGEKENAGSGRRMNGIALVFRIYHAFGQ